MKKLLLLALVLGLNDSVYAVNIITAPQSFPPVAWTSKDPRDTVTIENGNNASIMINITVPRSTGAASSVERGINISNCGKTTFVKEGSSAICYNQNGSAPVNFSSDSMNPISGTYVVTPR